jgi:ribosomal protein L11 methylase PrmA
VVLANIISSVVTTLLPAIAESLATAGRAILSGILREERADMLPLLESSGWRVEREDIEDMWWSASITRR